MIEITSLQEGFHRAGMAHPKGPTLHKEGTFTDDQLLELAGEPKLIVIVNVRPAEAEAVDAVSGAHDASVNRFDALVSACGELDEDQSNRDDWTKSGAPQILALESISQEKNISAAERDAVFTAYVEAQK